MAALIGVILANQLVKPLSSLTGAARAIATGDLQRRVAVSPVKRDEVNDLGRAFNDMAARVEDAQETLRQAAIRDGLTGLLNQREFFRRLAEEVSRADRGGRTLSMLMIDLDHLKAVNDTFGHLQGDAVLTEVARMIEACVREGDIVARYAGDEFAVILPNADGEHALAVGERMRTGSAGVAAAAACRPPPGWPCRWAWSPGRPGAGAPTHRRARRRGAVPRQARRPRPGGGRRRVEAGGDRPASS